MYLVYLLFNLTWHIQHRDFDDGLLQQITELAYEDDIRTVPSSPDVSNYLVSEVSLFNISTYSPLSGKCSLGSCIHQ